MAYGTDYQAPTPSSTEAPAGVARGWLPRLIVLGSVAYAAYLTILSLAGSGLHTGTTGVIGGVFLLLVLFPSNLLRFEWWSGRRALQVPLRFLTRLRKPLGVSAGVFFVAHTVVGFVEFFDFDASLVRQVLIGDIAIGLVATLIFVALLATSTDGAQRRLGSSWKPLQRLVWFAVPLSLAHTALSSARLWHLEPPGTFLFTLMTLFAAFELFALWRRRSRRGATGTVWTHARLVVAGLAFSVALYAASWLVVGPWDPTNDNFPGPPPGIEEEEFRARLEAGR